MTAAPARRLRAALALCLPFVATAVLAAAFTPGNVVVYRVGNGVTPFTTAGSPVFLDEYSPSGNLVQSLALPTATSGSHRALVASGTAGSDGLLTRSVDGTCLAVPGYGRDLGTGLGSLITGTVAGGGAIPRVVARVSVPGEIDTTTALTNAATGSNFRGAASLDCTGFHVGGGAGGVRFATLGASSSTGLTSGVGANVRAVSIYGGQLYTSVSVTSLRGVATVGSGVPTSGAAATVKLPGLTDENTPQPYAFFLADLDTDVPGVDTLYVADEAAGALSKFSLVGGTWQPRGTIGVAADTYRGITGVVRGTRVTLFATRGTENADTPGGQLVTLTDASGYNGMLTGTPSVIASGSALKVFRGVALAPASPVTVSPSAGPNGSITPNTPQVFPGGTTATFTVTPQAGYTAVVEGCGGSLAGTSFTTDILTANCSVNAVFAQTPFTITTVVGNNGSLSPVGPRSVLPGATATFTVTPLTGYSASIGGTCGGNLVGDTYTTAPVDADCTVTATFTLITFNVTPSVQGANGSLSPLAVQVVPLGARATFSVTPEFGFGATVGGSCGGTLAAGIYTTHPVSFDCTVEASFAALPRHAVTPSSGPNGSISPATPQSVMSGQATTFTVTPAPGYTAAVRGTCGGALSGNAFTTNAVTADCTVVAAFAKRLVLFVGNSYTFGRIDPVMSYNAAHVTDLTYAMWLANPTGSNDDEPHPWGGIPGIFKKLTDQAGLDYDVSISARNAASLRGHYLNSNPANWDLRGNIASQRWDAVVLQDLSDEPLPANRGANANLPYFNAYVDKIEAWIHQGAAETYTESQLFGGSTAQCRAITGASETACDTVRSIPTANPHANPASEIFLYQTWARPDMIAPNGTNVNGHFYSAAEGLEAMTLDFHAAYFGRAAANPRIEDVSAVGDAFLRAVTDGVAMRDPYVPEAGKINLWHTDYFHPSKYGSYLSALVHFATLTGLDPMALGPGEQAAADLGIAPAIAAQLQRVARATVMPDASPPMTTATLSVAPNAQGWHRGPVTVTFAANDNSGGWGVSTVTYSLTGAQSGAGSVAAGGAVTISVQGETTLAYFATDVAGNIEPAHTLVIRIDTTAPTLSVPANFSVDATGPGGASVSYTVTAADNSGVAPSFDCVPASGGTRSIGTNTITCTATDAAGNRAQAAFNVIVRGVPEQTAKLIAAVLSLKGINVSPAVVTQLTAFLQGALNTRNTPLFCAALTAFAKQVALLSGRGIPAAQAAQLVASANQIKAVQGCA